LCDDCGSETEIYTVWGYYIISLLPGRPFRFYQSMQIDTYLPASGLSCHGFSGVMEPIKMNTLKQWGPIITVLGVATVIFLLVSLSYLTVKQISIWRNSIDLWNYVVEKETEKVPLVYYSRGVALKKMGQRVKAGEDFDMVIA
jgi:hypothetical protein